MSGAYHPWSKFNAHRWSNLNARRHSELLHVTKMEQLTGIRAIHHEQLMAELLECGFLELVDIPGDLTEYRLLEDFEWSGRFKLFTQAHHDWLVAKNNTKRQPKNDIPDAVSSDGSGMAAWSDVLQRLSASGNRSNEHKRIQNANAILKTQLFRADKIYSWLAKQVKDHGNFLPYPNEEALIEAIHKDIGGKRKVIAPILFRKMDGVPKAFLVSFQKRPENPCWVRLASKLTTGDRESLPLTIEAIEDKNG